MLIVSRIKQWMNLKKCLSLSIILDYLLRRTLNIFLELSTAVAYQHCVEPNHFLTKAFLTNYIIDSFGFVLTINYLDN